MIADTQINTTIQNHQYDTSVATLDDGGFVMCWTSVIPYGSSLGIYAQRFNGNGEAQGGEFRVNTYTGYQASPTIAALNDGGFVVSWTSADQDGSGSGIYAQRYNANGVVQGSEFRVNTYTIGDQWLPVISALSDGGFVVIWRTDVQVGTGSGIYIQRFDANGVAQGEEFRANIYATEPAITALNDGGFVVSWSSLDQDGSAGIYAQRFSTNGVAQEAEFRVNTLTDGNQNLSAITTLKDGGFVVVWVSTLDGIDTEIYAQQFNANGEAQGIEFHVNTYTIGTQWSPAITALNDGGFVVGWTSNDQDGSGSGIYAKRYDVIGVAQGSEFLVNSYTINDQWIPAITALNDGDFVINWASLEQDGDGFGIFAHRYNAAGNEIGWTAADRLFNWAENIYPDLFPNHSESMEIIGYYARIYENGKALGEQNDNIYFYDGNSIILVGAVNDYLSDAIAAGF